MEAASSGTRGLAALSGSSVARVVLPAMLCLFLPLYGTSSVTFLCKLLPRQWRRSGTGKQSVFETVAGAWWRAHSDQPSAVAGSCLGLLRPGILAVFFLVITKVTLLCSFAAQNLEGTPESPWGA